MTSLGSVMLAAVCNHCHHKYPEFWVMRDHRGYPTFEGVVCTMCGVPNCLARDWSDNVLHVINQPLEDGQINRFEYSYTNEDGKKINKKMDPRDVQKHFENTSKGKK